MAVYRRNGVREYVVYRVFDAAVDWFVLRAAQYEPLPAGPDGIRRSEVFPGLWLDTAALIRGDTAAVFRALQTGLATPDHTAFVKQLAAFDRAIAFGVNVFVRCSVAPSSRAC